MLDMKHEVVLTKPSEIADLIRPTIETMGFSLYGLDLNIGGRKMRLKVFVEKPGDVGIDIDECAHISRRIGALLDAEAIVQGEYLLEVSSPGLDRPLFTTEQIKAQIGKNIAISCKNNNIKNIKGVLTRMDEHVFVLLTAEKEEVVIPFVDVTKAKVILDINFGTRPK